MSDKGNVRNTSSDFIVDDEPSEESEMDRLDERTRHLLLVANKNARVVKQHTKALDEHTKALSHLQQQDEITAQTIAQLQQQDELRGAEMRAIRATVMARSKDVPAKQPRTRGPSFRSVVGVPADDAADAFVNLCLDIGSNDETLTVSEVTQQLDAFFRRLDLPTIPKTSLRRALTTIHVRVHGCPNVRTAGVAHVFALVFRPGWEVTYSAELARLRGIYAAQ